MSSTGEKNSHARWRNLLEKHIDGELDAPARMELFGHLEECEECRETLEAEERLIDSLTRLPRLSAPSDLRAAILREAARERAETLQPLTEDARYAELLRGPDGESYGSAVSSGSADAANPVSGNPVPGGALGALNAHRKGHGYRSRWARYSPQFATAFLIISVTLTVFGRVFPSSPGRGWAGLRKDSPVSTAFAAVVRITVPEREARLEEISPEEKPGSPGARELALLPGEAPARGGESHASHGSPDDRPLLPVQQPGETTDAFRSALESAGLPLPAEQELPVTEAVVLKVLRTGNNSGSGKHLADALEHSLTEQLGGAIRQYKQSERSGQCSRAFTVDLSEGSCVSLLHALQAFRSDPELGQVLASDSVGLAEIPHDKLALFSGTEDALLECLKPAPGPEAGSNDRSTRRVLVLVME